MIWIRRACRADRQCGRSCWRASWRASTMRHPGEVHLQGLWPCPSQTPPRRRGRLREVNGDRRGSLSGPSLWCLRGAPEDSLWRRTLKAADVSGFVVVFNYFGPAGSSWPHVGFSSAVVGPPASCGVRAPHCAGFSCGARAWLPRGLWGLPGAGIKPLSPASAGGFSSTVPPQKS